MSTDYLSITGRLKEIINRGGEKISPREVDEIIMLHPAVHQCVTFALPHKMLGEDVAAAVVLRQGLSADDKELRVFASTRLAPFKVPQQDPHTPRDSGGCDGEVAAHRPRQETGTRITLPIVRRPYCGRRLVGRGRVVRR